VEPAEAVTVIMASPTPLKVTFPEELTDATEVLEEAKFGAEREPEPK
jgi:hypothetical protein